MELLQRDDERQFLHEVAVAGIQEHHVGRLVFRQRDIAAERQVAIAEPALFRHLALRHVADFRAGAAEQFGQFQRHVAVDQAADTDHHHRDVGQEVAEPVGRALLGRQHQAVVALQAAHAEALRFQVGLDLVSRQRALDAGAVGHGGQRLAGRAFAEGLHVLDEARRIAPDAQRGRGDQEHQDQQEPAGVVDVEQAERAVDLEPERAELECIVRVRLVLLEDRADHRGDGEDGKEPDGETHRAEQFVEAGGKASLAAFGRHGPHNVKRGRH